MNAFKYAIASNKRQIGLWQALASAYTAEICAGAGFDWLVLDCEHAPNDLPLILAQLQALAGYASVEPVVRLPSADTTLVKQYLDIGARTLLIPMIETVEQAVTMVRATQYPPNGVRGVGSAIARSSRWNRIPNYLEQAHQDICLLLQLENRAGIDQAEAIAAIDGVDGIFIGPADLAADLGHLGNPAHQDVQQIIEAAIHKILAAGKPVGMLVSDEALAARYLQLGASFVAVGTDVTLLARNAENLAVKFRSIANHSGPPDKNPI